MSLTVAAILILITQDSSNSFIEYGVMSQLGLLKDS